MNIRRVPPEHGTRARYFSARWPCACDECRAANREYVTAHRRGMKPQRITQTGPCAACGRGVREHGTGEVLWGCSA